jgi:hypothetical protein
VPRLLAVRGLVRHPPEVHEAQAVHAGSYGPRATLGVMSRPERSVPGIAGGPCCSGPAGVSPAAVSAGAPRSRLRARGEILSSECSIKSPQGAVSPPGGEQVRGPSIKRTLQPRDRSTRKRGSAELVMSQRRQQTAREPGSRQDTLGVRRTARGDSPLRNRRDPHRWSTSDRSGPYKPTAKGGQAGRESEGFVVPTRPGENPGGGKGPCFGHAGARR